ncbi:MULTISPECIES: 50S ribosomal protein L32 [Helcobacillus]|uniref:Large ribosomal subunit protein bL32 n=1 Tax=Helcobacillus massiliensis TaxID=521392 RepID=A0A839R1V6_9MICO|nr:MULTISPECIES: 50S ribosomal protein L32 [Helcobacillus]MBB3022626.1 large subunit ribosomal protein L32 [Helcobacillus massiliensis]MCG7427605.1 50S ribosomal protein L32 [Helcobacillus sp. ACRRO]MDK7743043.1 50S ribosomal protein L32 [Helcobacillus massiliensis]WOO91972.1 50S ribosomal protein L32 [Helcobacillus massiliensis]
MAVPKFKMSRARTRSRRAQWKAEATDLVQVSVRGRTARVPRRLAKAYQRGLIDIDA